MGCRYTQHDRQSILEGERVLEVDIREADLDDALALQRYASELFGERLPGLYERPVPTVEDEVQFLESYCGPANSVLLVADDAGRLVGLLGLLGRSLPQDAHVGSVGISVHRDYRGRGLGTRLMRTLFEWASSNGIRRIEIEAFANNPEAIRLYESLGFVREGVRRGAVVVDGEDVDVVCMARGPVD
jgi:RimJ/RimL family protein N-acetyltransferase